MAGVVPLPSNSDHKRPKVSSFCFVGDTFLPSTAEQKTGKGDNPADDPLPEIISKSMKLFENKGFP